MKDVSSIVPANFQSVKWASEILQSGGLVSFPTETVYGLGADAISHSAVLNVFKAKGRPLTDPLIVHLPDVKMLSSWTQLSKRLSILVDVLAERFWPGPLTLVLPKADGVSPIITAGQGTVAIRIPQHPVALSLLRTSGLALVAPSANKFGHVSPTCAQHVLDDFPNDGVLILDGGSCDVGIESTILQLTDDTAIILRRGLISAKQIDLAFAECAYRVQVLDKDQNEFCKDQDVAQSSPGQLLTHYAPRQPAFMIRTSQNFSDKGTLPNFHVLRSALDTRGINLSSTFVIDVFGRLKFLSAMTACYLDLAVPGSSVLNVNNEKAEFLEKNESPERRVLAYAFRALRWSEAQNNCKTILLPYLADSSSDLLQSLHERFFRSASGRVINLD